ncbi:MAG: hypothetical protein AB7G12_15710 [Thermoanaerobaculia bacterium]
MDERRVDRWSAAVLLLWACTAFWAASPRAVGLFSDDGIYLSTGRALAFEGDYRLTNLPGRYAQTKYPPLWPATLAGVWRLCPEQPRAERVAQGLAIFLTALSWWLFRRVASRRLGVSPVASLAVVILPVASPALFVSACWPLSEPLFGALCAGALLAATDAAGEAPSVRRQWLAGGLAAAAFLTRIHGVAFLVALAGAWLVVRRRDAAIRAVLPGALAMGGWLLWTKVHEVAVTPLVSYYTSYRHSGLDWETSGIRRQAADFLLEIARALEHFGGLLLGENGLGSWLLGGGVTIFVVAGARRLVRERRLPAILWLGAGIGIVALQPDPSARFLVSMLPLAIAVAGRAGPLPLGRRLAPLLVGALALSGLSEIAIEIAERDASVLPTPRSLASESSELASFDATAAFLRANVSEGEAIAAANDLWFHLETGRPVLRFWLYRPRLLARARHGGGLPTVGDPPEILAELSELGVRWLVIEPGSSDRFLEGPRILELGRAIVALPEAGAERRFLSPDRAHEVWHLDPVARGRSAAAPVER